MFLPATQVPWMLISMGRSTKQDRTTMHSLVVLLQVFIPPRGMQCLPSVGLQPPTVPHSMHIYSLDSTYMSTPGVPGTQKYLHAWCARPSIVICRSILLSVGIMAYSPPRRFAPWLVRLRTWYHCDTTTETLGDV